MKIKISLIIICLLASSQVFAQKKKKADEATLEFRYEAEAAVGHTSVKGSAKVKQLVKVVFKKDGRVEVGVHVTIKKGSKLTDVCLELQKEIAHALEVYVEAVPFEIEVSVDEVK